MKKLFFLIFSFLTFWLFAVDTAWSHDLSSDQQKVEILEGNLPPVEISEATDRLRIQVGRKQVFFIEKTPTAEEIRDAIDVKASFDPFRSYSELSEAEKIKFQTYRRKILTKVAQALTSSDMMLAAGVLIGEKYQMARAWFSDKENDVDVTAPLRLKKKEFVQAFLQVVDLKLWYHAPLWLNANEFGFEVSFGGFIQAGLRKKGWVLSQEIGFNFAYNKSENALVFEIFKMNERYYHSVTPMFIAGVEARAGISISNVEVEPDRKVQNGYTDTGFLSAFYTDYSDEHFGYGVKARLRAPPFGGIFAYTNAYERRTMVRLKMSPFMLGFINLQVGHHEVSPGRYLLSVHEFIVKIGQFIRKNSGHSCGRVFL